MRSRHMYNQHWTLVVAMVALAQACDPPPVEDSGGDSTSDTTATTTTTTTTGEGGTSGTGQVESDGSDSAGDSSTDTGEPASCEFDVGPDAPRALTRFQFENAVEDLVGVDRLLWSSDAAWDPIVMDHVGPFDSIPADAPGLAASIQFMADEIAWLVDVPSLLPCDLPAAEPEVCAEAFITQFGRATWRRPLDAGEIADLMTHYDTGDMDLGTRDTVAELLSSSNMWTVAQTGAVTAEDPDLVELDDWSLATRLALFLWNSTPDAQLLDHAEAGDLWDSVVLLAEAERLLADPRADRMLGDMYIAMMGVQQLHLVTKDPVVFPQFGSSLTAAMDRELRLFVADAVLGEGDGRVETLLDGPFTWVNDELATLYGADVVSTEGAPGPETFVRATLDPERRAGLWALPAVMTQHSREGQLGYTFRGLTIRENFLCQIVPPPPPASESPLPDPPFDRYAHWDAIMGAECQGCHQLMDSLSFAFDHYDPVGQWQTEADGVVVDPAGEVVGVSGVGDPSFIGRGELVEVMRNTDELPACMARQHLRFALRRAVTEADQCVLDELTEQLEQTDGDLQDMMLGIVGSETFRVVRN